MLNTTSEPTNTTQDFVQNSSSGENSWTNQASGQDNSHTTYLEYHIAHWVMLVYRPVCAVFGITGNTLCILVVMTTSLRHSPTAVYMVMLAALDWVVSLYSGLTVLPKDFFIGEQRFFTSSWHCQAYYFCLLFVIHFDALTLVSMTAQRYVAVTFPLHAARWNSRRGAALTLVFAAIIAFLANVVHLVTLRLQSFDGSYRGRCSIGSGFDQYFQMHIYPWIDSVLYFFFPTVTIGVLNVLISKAIKRADSFKAQATVDRNHNDECTQKFKAPCGIPANTAVDSHRQASCPDKNPRILQNEASAVCHQNNIAGNIGGNREQCIQHVESSSRGTSATSSNTDSIEMRSRPISQDKTRPRRASSSPQLTRMLLTVSMAFLVLTMPLGVFIVLSRYWNPTSGYQKAQFSLVRDVTESLMFTNHAINVVLYCLAGRRFRAKVMSVICRTCRTRTAPGGAVRSREELCRSGAWTSDVKTDDVSRTAASVYVTTVITDNVKEK